MSQKSFYIRSTQSEEKKVAMRVSLIEELRGSLLQKTQQFPFDIQAVGSKNCENLVGTVALPVGVVGPFDLPIIVNEKKQLFSDVIIPIATTEGALVASLSRGVRVLSFSNNFQVMVEKVGMSRAPVFECASSAVAKKFAAWVTDNTRFFEDAAVATSSHLHFLSLKTWIEGDLVFVRCVFDTGEAMGMNMVSIALSHWWQTLVPKELKKEVSLKALSSNMCTDKKPSQLNRELGRGYRVAAAATIPKKVLKEVLHVAAKDLVSTHVAKNSIGSRLAGIPAGNMHVANAVAGVFIATGQDPAHVVDVASSAVTHFEEVETGVKVSLEIASVPVGTVGGGTSLPAQSEWQQLILGQKLTAEALAASVAAAALGGEISGLAALCTQTLASAHKRLGRLR